MNEMRRMNITELAKELDRQKEASMDIVATSSTIQAMPHTEDVIRLGFPVPERGADGGGEDGRPEVIDLTNVPLPMADLDVSEGFPMTQQAHKQVAKKMKIPRTYYNYLREIGAGELLAHNVNYFMNTREARLLRILDGQVRAFLSDNYRPIDHYDLLYLFMDCIKEFKEREEIDIIQCDLSETRMYIKAKIPVFSDIVPEDTVQPMIVLRNSEVGAGRMELQLGMWRLACTNGMSVLDVMGRVHLGSKLEEGLIEWSKETVRKVDDALMSQLKDAVQSVMKLDSWNKILQNAHQAAETELEPTIVEIVNNISPRYSLTEGEKNSLLDMFAQGSGHVGKTAWALVNGITAVARESESVERQAELEKVGGKLMMMEPATIRHLVSVPAKAAPVTED